MKKTIIVASLFGAYSFLHADDRSAQQTYLPFLVKADDSPKWVISIPLERNTALSLKSIKKGTIYITSGITGENLKICDFVDPPFPFTSEETSIQKAEQDAAANP